MNRIFLTLFLSSLILISNAQITIGADNMCHDNSKYLECFTWLDYKMKFRESIMTSFSNKDSTIQYDVYQKKLKLFQRDDTLTVQLKENGVELHSFKVDSTKFINIVNNEIVYPFSISHVNIWPIYSSGKIFGVPIPVIDNGSITVIFYYGSISKKLSWNIIIQGKDKEKVNNPLQVKILSDAFYGEIESINMFYNNGFELATYKVARPGIELLYAFRNDGYSLWKTRKVIETKYQGIVSYSDIVEYDRKGKLKASEIKLKVCTCE